MADMEAQLTARFSAKRGDVALPAALVTLLVDHLVDVEMATEIDEVPPIEETILVAQAAWHAEHGKPLPALRERVVNAWVKSGFPPNPPGGMPLQPAAGTGAPTLVLPALVPAGGLEDADKELFGDADPTPREVAQLTSDKAAQRLTGVQLSVLSLAVELGTVLPASDVVGSFRYGSDARMSAASKEVLQSRLRGWQSSCDRQVWEHM